MIVEEYNNSELWNSFVYKNTQQTFHQSYQWGITQQKIGNKTWFWAVFDKGIIIAVFLTIKINAKRGVFLLVPHGPVFGTNLKMSQIKKCMGIIKNHLEKIGRKENCSFMRIAPILERNNENFGIFKHLGFKKAPIFVQSEQSLILDITPENDSILKQMRKSTRNILKKADNYSVTITSSDNKKDFDIFFNLYLKTVKKKHYTGHHKKFIKAEYDAFSAVRKAFIYICLYKKKPLSTALIILSDKTGFYHYGASVKNEKIPASHLLQWFIIQDLKKKGFTTYNFWGIAPNNNPSHPWYGLTIFKKGFGGEVIQFVPTQDFILSKFYFFNWVIETIRKIKRHY